jgi:spore coat protein X
MSRNQDEYESTKKKCNCKKCQDKNRQGTEEEQNMHDDAEVLQAGEQNSFIEQESDELVWIKDSCNIEVHSTDTQVAVSLQVGLQLAIALVISITVGDSDEGQNVAQDLFQQLNAEQTNKQKIIIENSKDVTITTTDTDLAVSIQALLQVLVALVAKLDVL